MDDLTKATPRPWRYTVPVALDYRAALIYDAENKSLIAQMCGGGRVRAIDAAEERANADLIVRAVNSHDDLVAVLDDALRCLEGLAAHARSPDAPIHKTIRHCRAILAKAKGCEP